MFLITLAAAAAAQAASPSAQERDLRCVVVISAILGTAEQSKRTTVTPLLLYYIGRVTARKPGINLEAEMRRVYGDETSFKTMFSAETKRCGAEMEVVGSELKRLGESLKQNQAVTPK